MKLVLAAALMFAASFAVAQEADGPGELPSLEEIDRQLNNPLSKTWALTLQDNIGIQEGDLVDGSTWNNLLFFQPLLPVPVSKNLMFSGRPVFPLVTSPNVDFSTGKSDGHTTGLGDIQLLTLIGPDKADGWVWGAGATFKFPTASDPVNGQGNFTDFQYIIRYMLPKAWSVGAGPSITYNHEAASGDRLTVPIGLGVTKTVRVGNLPMKLRAEAHYSVVRPDSYGEVWNFRLQVTPVIKSPFIK
jgi:hypothetical protein